MDEWNKCNFCRKYKNYWNCEMCEMCNYYDNFKADKDSIIKKAKEKGISVADVIALMELD